MTQITSETFNVPASSMSAANGSVALKILSVEPSNTVCAYTLRCSSHRERDNEALCIFGHRNSVIELNHLLMQVISSLTASLRSFGALYVTVTECRTDFVSQPRAVVSVEMFNIMRRTRTLRSVWR